jgi:hypothetical protein
MKVPDEGRLGLKDVLFLSSGPGLHRGTDRGATRKFRE